MDPYVYPGTSVLRNLRDIRDQERLDEFEAEAAARRLRQLQEKGMTGTFDRVHLQAIHHHIFQDVYPWAGEFRTMSIAKGQDMFAFPQHIEPSLNKTFEMLKRERYLQGADPEEFCRRTAVHLGDINAIHPFREGNGRTQREFIRQLAERNAIVLDWRKVTREEMIEASRQSFRTGEEGLERLLRQAIDSERSRERAEQRAWLSRFEEPEAEQDIEPEQEL